MRQGNKYLLIQFILLETLHMKQTYNPIILNFI